MLAVEFKRIWWQSATVKGFRREQSEYETAEMCFPAIAPPFNPTVSGGSAPRTKFKNTHIAMNPNVDCRD